MKKHLIRTLFLLCLCVLLVPCRPQAAKVRTATLTKRKSKVYMRKNQLKRFRIKGCKKKIRWRTKNKTNISISRYGIVQGLKAGTAVIRGKAKGKTYKCRIVVVNISKKNAFLKTGDGKKLRVIHGGDNVKWSSTDKTVATVKNGEVKAHGTGKCTITAKARGYTFHCKVFVPSVTFPTGRITTSTTLPETPAESSPTDATPASATSVKVAAKIKVENFKHMPRFYSSNPSVAEVLDDGSIIANGSGSTTITVKGDGLEFTHVLVISNSQVDRFLKYLKKYNKYVKAHGEYFKRADTPEESFADVKKLVSQGKTAKINCRAPSSWAFYDMGFRPSAVYGKNGTFKSCFKGTMKLYLTRITKGPVIGLTYRQAVDQGLLQPGDICCFKGRTHTFTYSGEGYKFYDAGSLCQRAGYSKVGCCPDYTVLKYNEDRYINEILRWNE